MTRIPAYLAARRALQQSHPRKVVRRHPYFQISISSIPRFWAARWIVNRQDQKEAFIAKAGDTSTRNPGSLQLPASPYQVMAGNLSIQLMTTLNAILATRGLTPKTSTVVDATLIGAPSSTKNSTGERDPGWRRSLAQPSVFCMGLMRDDSGD